MKECLATGYDHRARLLGRPVILAIRAGNVDCPCARTETHQRASERRITARKWLTSQLSNQGNGAPGEACGPSSESFRQRLNQRCPCRVPAEAIVPAEMVHRKIDGIRNSSSDLHLARKRRKRVCLESLHSQFARLAPAERVDRLRTGAQSPCPPKRTAVR